MGLFRDHGREGPNLFALPPGRPFFDDLVGALLSEFEGQPEALPGVQVFVPSRRSVRALKESFLRRSPGGVVLLPRITAVADLSEEDALTDAIERRSDPLPASPAPPIKRLELAAIYRAARAGQAPSWATALRSADDLARTSDQLTEYGIGMDRLKDLAGMPAITESAEHWGQVLGLLRLCAENWPAWLEREGLLDARVRRTELLAAVTRGLASEARSELIVAAGFLGTSPSSQRFLEAVAHLPHGAVVLPALDRDMEGGEWEAIDAPHPQSAYKTLLKGGFGVSREGVRDLPYRDERGAALRRRFVSLALMPTDATDGWFERFQAFKAEPGAGEALDGLEVAVAETQEEEADFIALELRSVLEEPGKSAFLVTADRTLGRRVAAKLRGWGVEIDDSGGAPLGGSYRATFMRLVARLMAEPSDPVAMAGLIHHQLFSMGMSPAERMPMIQAADAFLRGRAPRAGWDGLLASLDDRWRPCQRSWGKEGREKAEAFFRRLRDIFEEGAAEGTVSCAELLPRHIAIAEALAARPGEAGSARLFRFEDGEALESHLQTLLSRPDMLPHTDIAEYPEVFDALLQGPAVRPPGGQHPRLSIFGILEARLQTADHIVVGGLQEGVWPGDEVVDPFLSRGMRRELGLPSPDADIGRVAHDFADFASAPRVLLTRSARRGRSPAGPSRFMVRLESFLADLDPAKRYDAAPRLRAWRAARFDGGGIAVPAPRPAPRPPSDKRPAKLSISEVGTWLRDPYAIYATHVLRLRPAKTYDEPFGPSHRGDFLHGLLEEFIRYQIEDPDDDIKGRLELLLPDIADRFAIPESVRFLNRRFVDNAFKAFGEFEEKARAVSEPLTVEAKGEVTLSAEDREVVVRGRADRLDLHADGVHVIDYKSGGKASVKEDRTFSPQLFLTALMVERGGFPGIAAQPCWQVSFVKLNQYEDVFCKPQKKASRFCRGDELKDALADFETKLTDWLSLQYREETPFHPQLHPYRSDIMGDYDELSRRLEWMREAADE